MKRAAAMLFATSIAVLGIFEQAAPAAARASSRTASTAPAYDVSYPQCGSSLPGGGSTGIVGVTDGLPWSTNPCLASEYRWAAARPQPAQVYMNAANPETASSYWSTRAGTGPATCASLTSPSDLGCAYNYGWNSAADALGRARAAVGTVTAATHAWWLDVETGNSWNGSTAANSQDLQGSVDYLRGAGVPGVGFYSTSYQWGVITGGWQAPGGTSGAPSDWVAGARGATQATSWCSPSYAFSGGAVRLVQYPSGAFDGDHIC